MRRLAQAGFAPEAIFNLGSLKYDVAALGSSEADISAWWDRTGWSSEQPILLGGSTHPGEEEVLSRIFLQLRERWPDLRLVLAPRHAERGAAICDLCDRMGLRPVTRTQLAAATEPLANGKSPDVLVVNSTGELRSLYKRATLAFVGKSLRGQGGQNFIEAAPGGTPIIVGPNMQNFEVATREFLSRKAIVQVMDEFELGRRTRGNAILRGAVESVGRREMSFAPRQTFPFGGKTAGARGLLQSSAGRLDEKKMELVKSTWFPQGMTCHHHPGMAVPLALVIERKLELGSLCEMPFREQLHALRRPSNLIPDETDRIGKIDRDAGSRWGLGFAGRWHCRKSSRSFLTLLRKGYCQSSPCENRPALAPPRGASSTDYNKPDFEIIN